MKKLIVLSLCGCAVFALIACQSAVEVTPVVAPVAQPQGIPTPEGVVVIPYEHPDIQRQRIPTAK